METHPQTSLRELSFRTHPSRFSRAAVQTEACKYGDLDSKRRKNDFNLRFQRIARRVEVVALLHRPPLLFLLMIPVSDWRARLPTVVSPCTIPPLLCERWLLVCAFLTATRTVLLSSPRNQSKSRLYRVWSAQSRANPKVTRMALPAA